MTSTGDATGWPVVLITGGAGFLGRRMVEAFLAPDCPVSVGEVRVFDCRPLTGIRDDRLRFVQGDVRDYDALCGAFAGVDLVIHAAAVVDWGTRPEAEVFGVNYGGTENVLRACRKTGVERLIYTSSIDAVFDGKPRRDIDETHPYPEQHPNMYCRSKCMAEQRVLAANDARLKTCALRPSDIYGEDDPYHIAAFINMAKGGFYVRLGNGAARSQHVYVGNMAHAHVLAAKALLEGNTAVEGQVYFITDGAGHNFFSFFDRIVSEAGYNIWPRNLWLPAWFAYGLGTVSEWIAYALRPVKFYQPQLSRFAVRYTTTDFTFSAARAKQDFAYQPKYTEAEALRRTAGFYRRTEGVKD